MEGRERGGVAVSGKRVDLALALAISPCLPDGSEPGCGTSNHGAAVGLFCGLCGALGPPWGRSRNKDAPQIAANYPELIELQLLMGKLTFWVWPADQCSPLCGESSRGGGGGTRLFRSYNRLFARVRREISSVCDSADPGLRFQMLVG